jgi:hypothetical protein
MLTRSAKRLLGRSRALARYHNEASSKPAHLSSLLYFQGRSPLLTELSTVATSNGECSGFSKSLWKGGAFSGHRMHSTTGIRVAEPLQQGMTEMVPDLGPLPSDIRSEDLVITRSKHLQVKPRLDAATLQFGALHTDHMLQVSWKDGLGWTTPSIDPLGPISLHPCAQVRSSVHISILSE